LLRGTQIEKNHEGREFIMILEFKGTTGVGWYILGLNLVEGKRISLLTRGEGLFVLNY